MPQRLSGQACCCLLATSLLLSTGLVQGQELRAQERAADPIALASLAPNATLDEPAEASASAGLDGPLAIKDGPHGKRDALSIAEPKDDKPTPIERARAALAQSTAPALSDSEVCT